MARIVIDTGNVTVDGGYDVPLPTMTPVRQKFDAPRVDDLAGTVAAEFGRRDLGVRPGDRVAVAVGSRGIANLAPIVQATIGELIRLGCKPFVVPAMGSHGAATAPGQEEVLAEYGITEDSVGAPVHATMDTVRLGQVDGIDVYFDRIAHEEADAIVTVSRIKPHTSFRGPIESGIHKMLAIGMGKHHGATTVHRGGMQEFTTLVPHIGAFLIENTSYVGSIAVLENARHETAHLELVTKADLPGREEELLAQARELMPRLHIDDIDVLVVDEVGKDISGGGMDTNVVGRVPGGLIDFDRPRVTRIVVLGLTEATNGHPGAIGMADFISADTASKLNFGALYTNCITDTEPDGAKLPMIIDTAEHAIVVAMRTAHQQRMEDVRVVRIKNTLAVEQIQVSDNLLDVVAAHPALDVAGPPVPWNL